MLYIVCSVLFSADDNRNVFSEVGEGVEGCLKVLPLLAAGEVAQNWLVLNLEVFQLDVGLWNDRRYGPRSNSRYKENVVSVGAGQE